MKPIAATASKSRPNRLLVALAAAWMILSLAIGGAVSGESSAGAGQPAPITSTVDQ